MQLLLPVGIAIALVGGGFALHQTGLIEDLRNHLATPDQYPSEHCHEVPWVPLAAAPGAETRRVDFVIDNRGDADTGMVCLYDENLVKRFHKEFHVPGNTVVTEGFDVPVGWLYAQTVLGDPVATTAFGRGGWTGGGNWVKPCQDGVTQIRTTNTVAGTSRRSSGDAPRCEAAQMSLDGKSIIPMGGGEGPGNGALLATAVAGGSVLLALLAWGRHLGWFAFFSRLQHSTLLDHERRARIVELVEADPGVHGSEIMDTLELSPGVASHHLGVLTRERLLAKVGLPGSRHYFPFGKFSPLRMRALAMSRRPAARRVLAALSEMPHASLSSLSTATGFSIGRLSRLARQLESTHLVRRRSEGRKVILERVPLPA